MGRIFREYLKIFGEIKEDIFGDMRSDLASDLNFMAQNTYLTRLDCYHACLDCFGPFGTKWQKERKFPSVLSCWLCCY